jgi:CheY-like chemotaxis protein
LARKLPSNKGGDKGIEKQAIPEGKARGGEKMKTVLIVEDEAILRESLRDWLREGGYQVETAESGEEALEIIAEQDFGVVILDLRLPGKDGIEVLKEAKTKRPGLKGIIITAYPSVETAVQAMKEGAVDYLPKPLHLNELEKLIEQNLGLVEIGTMVEAVTKEAVAEPIMVEMARVEEVKAIKPEAGGFWEGKKPCWEMCQCPQVIRSECPALEHQSLPCWAIEGTYCKLDDYGARGDDVSTCQVCRVYRKWGGGEPIQIKLYGKGMNSMRVRAKD